MLDQDLFLEIAENNPKQQTLFKQFHISSNVSVPDY